MDYEKKYNHALEVVRELQKDWASTQNRAAGEIELAFPELRESEDERVRKAIDEILKLDEAWQIAGNYGLTVVNIRKYLEKQKEQNPAEWRDKDKNIFNLALDLIKHSDDCNGILDKELAVKWFTELPSRFNLQPKQEWSKEDKEKLYQVIAILSADKEIAIREYPFCKPLQKSYDNMIAFLEFLLSSYKPSEELT